jgi:hypothetical protein
MVFIKYQSAYEKHWQKIAREIKNISDFSIEDGATQRSVIKESMRKSRLSKKTQDRLMEHFVAGITARCASELI